MKKNEEWVISHFPDDFKNLTYVEPYCDNSTVFLEKEKSVVEVINDKNSNLINFYKAIRDEYKEFQKRLNYQKFSESTFEKFSKLEIKDYIDIATKDFVLKKMSKNEEKQIFNLTKIKTALWENSLKELPAIANRLQGTFIYNKDSIQVINTFNFQDTLLYCKPPYLKENKVSKKVYTSEMKTEDHMNLSYLLQNFKGKVILRGYASPLYNRLYKGWNLEKTKTNEQDKKENKIEVIWKNY
ncbi:MAG: DNA adenine methylase [Neisseriaceae bacterium]|nr:MAG: DNA adenine methylase [Neisseriaceae bacterium]